MIWFKSEVEKRGAAIRYAPNLQNDGSVVLCRTNDCQKPSVDVREEASLHRAPQSKRHYGEYPRVASGRGDFGDMSADTRRW